MRTKEEEIQIIQELVNTNKAEQMRVSRLQSLQSESFHGPPMPPQKPERVFADRKPYPKVTSDLKPNYGLMLGPFAIVLIPVLSAFVVFSIIWALVYYFGVFSSQKRDDITRIKALPEYKHQCETIDAENYAAQEQLDVTFRAKLMEWNEKMKVYNATEFRAYQEKKQKWLEEQAVRIQQTKDQYAECGGRFNEILLETKILPQPYTEYSILKFILDTITSSDFTVRDAVEMYDRKLQMQVDQARLAAQQSANQLAEDQNYLLDQQNAIAEQARVDARNAAIVATIQRHQMNKRLK